MAGLPDATEQQHHGHPDFRVRNKIFATLWPKTDSSNVRLPSMAAHAAAATEPGVYRLINDRGGTAWLAVHLPSANLLEFRELLEEAWRLRAPADVVAAYEEGKRR